MFLKVTLGEPTVLERENSQRNHSSVLINDFREKNSLWQGGEESSCTQKKRRIKSDEEKNDLLFLL